MKQKETKRTKDVPTLHSQLSALSKNRAKAMCVSSFVAFVTFCKNIQIVMICENMR